MRIQSIKLINFTDAHPNTELVLNGKSAMITGPNGSGKSSILNAITFALTNETIKRNRIRLPGNPDEPFSVELVITHNKKTYTIQNGGVIKRGKVSPKVLLTVGDKEYKGAREVFGFIGTEFNLDKELFLNNIYKQQGSITKLTDSTEAERINLFHKIIGIDRYTELQSLCKKAASSIVIECTPEICQERIDESEERIKELKQRVDVDENKIQQSMDALSKCKKDGEEIKIKIEAEEETRDSAEHKLQDIDKLESEINNKTEWIELMKHNISEKDVLIKKLETLKTSEKKLLTEFKEAQTETRTIQQKLTNLKTSTLSKWRNRVAELTDRKEDLEIELQSFSNLATVHQLRVEKRANIKAKIERIKKSINTAREYLESMTGVKKQYDIEVKKRNKVLGSAIQVSIPDDLDIASLDGTPCTICNNTINISQCKDRIEILRDLNDIVEKVENLKENMAAAKAIVKQIFDDHGVENIKELRNALPVHEKIEIDIHNKIVEEKKQLEECDKIKEKLNIIEANISQYERKISELEWDLREQFSDEEISDISDDEYIKTIRDLEDSLVEAQSNEVNTKLEVQSTANNIKNILEKLDKIKKEEKLCNKVKKEIATLEKQKEGMPRKIGLLTIKETANEILESLTNQLHELRVEISSHKNNIYNCKELLARTKEDINKEKKNINSQNEMISKISTKAKKKELLTNVIDILHRDNLPKLVRNNYISVINKKLKTLHKIFGFQFEPYVDETISFEDYEILSGAQKISYAISLDFALKQTLIPHINFMLLDEPTNHLDDERKAVLKDFLEALISKKSLQIITSTHCPLLTEIESCQIIQLGGHA